MGAHSINFLGLRGTLHLFLGGTLNLFLGFGAAGILLPLGTKAVVLHGYWANGLPFGYEGGHNEYACLEKGVWWGP